MQWTSGDFEAQIGPTVGANHQRKTIAIQKEEVDLFLWDTAGQEQFQALTPLYAHSASCALIVVAINDRDSFRGIATWTDLLMRSCDKVPPMILLVNKMDRANKASYSTDEIKEQYGASFQAIFFVSAVTAEGVDAAFLNAGELAYRFSVQSSEPGVRSIEPSQPPEPKLCCA
jgi:small GTP-binding protein